MSWLKKVGQFIASGVKEASLFLPFLAPIAALIPGATGAKVAAAVNEYVPAVESDLLAMQNIVVNVESMYAAITKQTTGGGAAKLAAAIPYFNSLLTSSESVLGHKIANPDLFNKAVAEYAQATVDLLNSREAGSSVPVPQPQPQS